ncbi:hypothetical protein JWG88_18245 [Desulfopila inferna]|nr:hypothetical protein [Desulfopila inferna]
MRITGSIGIVYTKFTKRATGDAGAAREVLPVISIDGNRLLSGMMIG